MKARGGWTAGGWPGEPALGRWRGLFSRGFQFGAQAALVVAVLAAPLVLALRLAAPRAEADLTFVSGPEPETLDPARASAVIEVRLLSALFEGLVRLDERTLEPRPAAAERFEVAPGFRRFELVLREGLVWSDGRPLVAEDYVAAWRRAADPSTRSPLRREAALVAGAARAEGPRRIVIEPARPLPELLSLLTLPCFLPVRLDVVERFGERWTRPEHMVSNGPFKLAEWRIGERLRLVRNERFHGPVGLGSIEALTTSGAAVGSDTAFLLYETGVADLAFSVPAGAYEALAGRPDLYAGDALATLFLRFNTTRGPLGDARVRRALARSIDREAIVREIVRGGERPSAAFVPPGLAGYHPAAGLGYDLSAARAELAAWRRDQTGRSGAAAGPAAAGEVDPSDGAPPLRFEMLFAASDETAGHVCEVLQAAWREALGAEVTLRPMERKAYYAAMRRLDYDACWSSWYADYPDPANFLEIFRAGSGNNRTGFADPGYDALLGEAAAAPSTEARLETLRAAEARLLRAAPLAPLWHPRRAVLCRPRIAGYEPSPLSIVRWEALSLGAEPRAARDAAGGGAAAAADPAPARGAPGAPGAPR